MHKVKVLLAALSMAGLATGVGVSPVLAHNAAHMYINGNCLEVGSDKSAPFVGQGEHASPPGRPSGWARFWFNHAVRGTGSGGGGIRTHE